jgi:N-methylhydantoinase A
LLESRPVCFDADAGAIPTPFYRREALAAGTRLDGPAIIVQPDTTTVLRPGQGCHVDDAGNLIITLNRAA